MSWTRPIVGVAVSAAMAGCADLTPLEIGACGNSVVEPLAGEDCDGVVDDALGDELACGPPGELATACRYLCSGAECPQGWSCDDDGICHAPSGQFAPAQNPVAVLRAEDIALANVVGEEEFELIARLDGELLVLGYDDVGFRPQVQVSIPNPRGPLAFGDVDGDARDDLFAPAASSSFKAAALAQVHVLRGDGERLASAVVPQSSAATPILVATAVHSSGSRARELLQVIDDDGVALRIDDAACNNDPSGSRVALGDVPTDAVLRPISAPHPSGGGQVLVFAQGQRTLTRLSVGRECGAGACSDPVMGEGCATTLDVLQQLELANPVTLAGCVFMDVDEDGDADVACNVSGGVEIATDAEGTLERAAAMTQRRFDDLSDLPDGQSLGCAAENQILAVADLDVDGRVDIVTAHGLFTATDDGYRRAFARTSGDAWGDAVTGDFDRDGRPDVVATVLRASADCASTGMQHLVQTDGTFNEITVAQVSSPRRLRTADFDGDGIDDVAAVEAGVVGEHVSVFFGDAKEPLEDKNTVGAFADVSELLALPTRSGTNPNDDLVGDLVVVSEAGQFSTFVTGNTRRSLLSPLTFEGAGSPASATLVGTLAPEQGGRNSALGDLLLIGSANAWLLRDDDVHHGREPIVLAADAFGIRTECSTWGVGRASEEGGTLFAGVDGFAHRLVSVDAGCDLAVREPALFVGLFTGDRSAPKLVSRVAAMSGRREPTKIEVFDLDGSGLDDVVVHFSRSTDGRSGDVVWLRDPDPTSGGLPIVERLPFRRDVLAIVGANADRDATRELLALTDEGVVVLDYDSTEGSFWVSDEPVVAMPPGDAAGSIVLAAGDADGDELTDLALLFGDAIYLYPAEPAN